LYYTHFIFTDHYLEYVKEIEEENYNGMLYRSTISDML